VFNLFTEVSIRQTAVLKVITDVLPAADRGEVSLLCMLNLSVAFDTVDHDLLIARLQQSFDDKKQALPWIESSPFYGTGRSQSASMGYSRLDRH